MCAANRVDATSGGGDVFKYAWSTRSPSTSTSAPRVGISERFLLPLLEGLLRSFPFPILDMAPERAAG